MRKAVRVANPCEQCGKRFRTRAGRPETRRFCSLKCSGRSRRPATKVCPKCKAERPYESFPRSGNGRAVSCANCYRPQGPAPLVYAPAPCKTCKAPFAEPKPRCRMKTRLYCSKECARLASAKEARACQACRMTFPASEFYRPDQPRTVFCQACSTARQLRSTLGFGYMVPFEMAYRNARLLARSSRVSFDLTRAEAQALYGKPCNFCGAPGCVFRPSIAGEGYGRSLAGILCWVCGKLHRLKKGGFSDESLLAYAKALVRTLRG